MTKPTSKVMAGVAVAALATAGVAAVIRYRQGQKPDPDGQKAITNWKVMGRGEGLCWLAMEPVTGRTHQLRVHSAATGWPIGWPPGSSRRCPTRPR